MFVSSAYFVGAMIPKGNCCHLTLFCVLYLTYGPSDSDAPLIAKTNALSAVMKTK